MKARRHRTSDITSRLEKEKGGPIVHYAFGALTGGLYGGLAEYSSKVTSGFGTSFGGVLFSTADFLAVPALNLAPSPSDQPASALATPFAAHIIYGATTEFVRRIVRRMLYSRTDCLVQMDGPASHFQAKAGAVCLAGLFASIPGLSLSLSRMTLDFI